jgi:uncharacterized protein YkwD
MLRAALIALALLATPAAAGSAEDQVLALANSYRAQAGCGPLRANAKLVAAAAGHAKAMAQQNFFSHTGKNGSTPSRRAGAQGYRYRALAENIAAGYASPQKTMASWMGSSGHRRNLLNCRYNETGIAMVYQPDDQPLPGQKYPMKYYWVQVFGKQ